MNKSEDEDEEDENKVKMKIRHSEMNIMVVMTVLTRWQRPVTVWWHRLST